MYRTENKSNPYVQGLSSTARPHERDAAIRVAEQFRTDTYKDSNYVLRWKSNDQVPPQEILDFWKHIGRRFNMSKSIAARNKESKEFISQYKKSMQNHKPSAEEMYEMRAAFGGGSTVIDIITGKKTKL